MEGVHALCSMQTTLTDIMSGDGRMSGKGKQPWSLPGSLRQSCSGSKSLGKTAWEPPPDGWIKVNVDGSFVPQTGEAGIGVVARDSES